jgi:cold shock CspA family protein/ribosome-associated translation inhibitor RaiA
MTLATQITFRHMEPSPALEAEVRKEAFALERFCNQIKSCRVVITAPQHREYGGLIKVRIDVGFHSEDLVVEHNPSLHTDARTREAIRQTGQSEPNREHRDPAGAIRDAFQEMRRRLHACMEKLRGQAKQHEGISSGTVTKLSPADDFGFLDSEGHGVYFHRNSVLDGHFDRLRLGSRVRFVEEIGEKGPQASSVRLVRSALQGRRAANFALLPAAGRLPRCAHTIKEKGSQ